MQQLRLMGLALFITAIFLALAAAITKTTHIQHGSGEPQRTTSSDSMVLPPPNELGFNANEPPPDSNAIQFTSVPIVWPLIIAAGVGLLMWFMPAREARG